MRKFFMFLVMLLLCITLCSCNDNDRVTVSGEDTTEGTSMFVRIEQAKHWLVVYHRETKVMYVVSNDEYIQGVFTVLVDENGDPMIYGGK